MMNELRRPIGKPPECTPPRLRSLSTRSTAENFSRQVVDAEGHECQQAPEHAQRVIMALEIQTNTMGCSFLRMTENTLDIAEDMLSPSPNMVERYVIYAGATDLFVSSRTLRYFSEALNNLRSRFTITLQRLPSSDFSSANFVDFLNTLEGFTILDADETFPSRFERHATSSKVHAIAAQRPLSVACSGAILSILRRHRMSSEHRTATSLQLNVVRTFSLRHFMTISDDVLQSLQIFAPPHRSYPQTYAKDSARGTFRSIYELISTFCSTCQGRNRLRQILQRPMCHIESIRQRHQAIANFLKPENACSTHEATLTLSKITDMRTSVELLRKGADCLFCCQAFGKSPWVRVRCFVTHVVRLRNISLGILSGTNLSIRRLVSENIVSKQYPLQGARLAKGACKVAGGINPDAMGAVGRMICETIDFNQSQSNDQLLIKTGVDPELDRIRRQSDGMDSLLVEVAKDLSQTLPRTTAQFMKCCAFFPHLGFLIALDPDLDTVADPPHFGHCDGSWQHVFSSDGITYYKDDHMRDLDEEYGDIYCEIRDREVEVLHRLVAQVLQFQDELITASDTCGELDAILSFTLAAEKYKWALPVMNADDDILQIEEGRHPLQELSVPAFVPNDCSLSSSSPSPSVQNLSRIILLTGPNNSGKSIFLKQVACIVYLAHVGSFVPAKSAVIGIADGILARIITEESVITGKSAFAIDLAQLADILKTWTSRSLIIVDEIGKGTNCDDGSGLLASFIEYFLYQNGSIPKILIATHFYEIFGSSAIKANPRLQLAHMAIARNDDAQAVTEDIVFLFKVRTGISHSSLGGYCAQFNGVPNVIVSRADAMAVLLDREEDIRVSCTKLTSDEEKRLQDAEHVARDFLSYDFVSPEAVAEAAEANTRQRLRSLLRKTEAPPHLGR